MKTRRQFLKISAQAIAAQSLLFYPWKNAEAILPSSERVSPSDRPTIAILGAGIAGLYSAWRLTQMGYSVQVFEAQHRIGGRAWTIRSGDSGSPFLPGKHNYMNAGPARIPHQHERALDLCRELGVDLEVFINENRNSWVIGKNEKPYRLKQALASERGYLSELLHQAISANSTGTSGLSVQQIQEIARSFGDLDESGKFVGSGRGGFIRYGWTDGKHERNSTVPLQDWYASDFFRDHARLFEYSSMGSPLFQPVGGFDRIPHALYSHIKDRVHTRRAVVAVRKKAEADFSITVQGPDGRRSEVQASAVICTIPLTRLKRIPLEGLAPELIQGIEANGSEYFPAVKFGTQYRERFWEQKDRIYGGISQFTEHLQQVVYPSHGVHSRQGGVVITGYLNEDLKEAARISALSRAEQNRLVQEELTKIHPKHAKYSVGMLPICWLKMPHHEGAWPTGEHPDTMKSLETFMNLTGGFQLAGEHVAYNFGWAEGAIASSDRAINRIVGR